MTTVRREAAPLEYVDAAVVAGGAGDAGYARNGVVEGTIRSLSVTVADCVSGWLNSTAVAELLLCVCPVLAELSSMRVTCHLGCLDVQALAAAPVRDA